MCHPAALVSMPRSHNESILYFQQVSGIRDPRTRLTGIRGGRACSEEEIETSDSDWLWREPIMTCKIPELRTRERASKHARPLTGIQSHIISLIHGILCSRVPTGQWASSWTSTSGRGMQPCDDTNESCHFTSPLRNSDIVRRRTLARARRDMPPERLGLETS